MPGSRNEATPETLLYRQRLRAKDHVFTKDASGLGFRYSEQASRANSLGTHLHPGKSGRHSTIADAGNAGHGYPQSQMYGYWDLRIGPNYH